MIASAGAGALLLASCGGTPKATVKVSNLLDFDRNCEAVEVPLSELAQKLDARYYVVYDAEGNELPSQVTSDSTLLFLASVPAGSTAVYSVAASDTVPVYSAKALGRVYPERDDDLGWENDLVGFRAYGPALQRRGERGFGYDIFLKRSTTDPVLDTLYAIELDPANWAKAREFGKVSREAADSFINTFSYHVDHGLGMDCYAVGPTLGAGVAALVVNDTIRFPWCYKDVEILDNGPLRFRAHLTFNPVTIGNDTAVVEHRVITLDAGSQLNSTEVSYEGLTPGIYDVVAGYSLHDDGPYTADAANGFISYLDPTQGPDNGELYMGLVAGDGFTPVSRDGHLVMAGKLDSGSALDYWWGFAWDRAEQAASPVKSLDEWNAYLEAFRRGVEAPLEVTVE